MSPSIHSNTDDKSLNMNITGEEQLPTKQEERTNVNTISRGPYPSEICLGTKDSRIMRISRSFGGKDRHSKVFTARGLRDRRVRLSVQTAIQLYDLQDRLGLNQPSRAVDWLLNVAQREIDLLPPLQMPAENFSQYQQMAASHEVAASQVPFSSCFGVNPETIRCTGAHSSDVKSKDNITSADHAASSESIYWKSNSPFRAGSKEVRREIIFEKGDRYKWNEHENQKAIAVRGTQEFPSNSLHKPPYTSCYQWEWPSNHYEIGGTYNSSNSDVQSSPSLPSRSQPQLLLYPSETIPSNAPCYLGALLDHVPKQMNHL